MSTTQDNEATEYEAEALRCSALADMRPWAAEYYRRRAARHNAIAARIRAGQPAYPSSVPEGGV